MAPTFRSRFGQPSFLCPMPLENELSTVEWHSAHVMPSRVRLSLPFTLVTVPTRPTTAFSLSKVTVVAGSLRSTLPALIAAATSGGMASASTLSPTERAVVGLTDFWTTSCMRAVSVQNCSSPKVSKRKTLWPEASVAGERSSAAGPAPVGLPGRVSSDGGRVAHAVVTRNAATTRRTNGGKFSPRAMSGPVRVAIQPPDLSRRSLMTRRSRRDCQGQTAFIPPRCDGLDTWAASHR